jgi:translation initiation factor IF-2
MVQVVEGCVRRDALKVRVKRTNQVVWEGKLLQLKQEKQVVDQVGQGLECGLMFDGFEDFQVGDTLEVIEMQKRRPKVTSTDTGAVRIQE